jgi:hypothetical protein
LPSTGDRERQHAPERCRIDGDRRIRGATTGQDLGEQPAERVPDEGRSRLQLADDGREVIGDLSHRLVGEDLGVLLRFVDRVGIVGPARRERGVAGLLEHDAPAVPTAGEQPEAVDEHDRVPPRLVRLVDLLGFVRGDVGHETLPTLLSRLFCRARVSRVPPLPNVYLAAHQNQEWRRPERGRPVAQVYGESGTVAPDPGSA